MTQRQQKIRVKEIDYNDQTTANFLAGWSLDRDSNEAVLQKVERGEYRKVWIGCDTGHMGLFECQELHKEKYETGYSYNRYCKLCHDALRDLKTYRFYNGYEIQFAVDFAESEKALAAKKQELDTAIAEAASMKAKEQEAEKQRLQTLKETAQRTGQRQVLTEYSEECDGSTDECSIDNIIEYINAKGEVEIERIHTY